MARSTSQAFVDGILSKFLYAQGTAPENLDNESFIRPKDATLFPPVNLLASDFMAGPGRFARATYFEIVQRFFREMRFDLPIGTAGIDYNVGPNGEIIYSKSKLITLLGIANAGLAFNQRLFDDGADDYMSRVYLWGTTSFQISDTAEFVLFADGYKEIRELAIEPRKENGAYRNEDFDFDGGSESESVEFFSKPPFDPFDVGRTVSIQFDGMVAVRTYTSSDFIDEVALPSATVGGGDPSYNTSGGVYSSYQDLIASSVKLAAGRDSFFQGLYDRGVVNYQTDGFDVYFGTDESDTIDASSSGSMPHQDYQPAASKGALIVAGAGSDTLLGNGSKQNRLRGGAGDDLLIGGAERDEGFGGADNDELRGAEGDDHLFGEGGEDRVLGEAGNDHLHGNEGDDKVAGGDGDDELYGDEGKDIVAGEDGRDRLFGGIGDDILIGGRESDTLNGEQGNDIIDAAQDDESGDVLRGGSGSDRFLTNSGDRILDPDGGDKVKLEGRWLSGGERKRPPADPCNPNSGDDQEDSKTYKGADGTKYTLNGSTLSVVNPLGATLTIENFRNGNAGIRLKDTRPNQDQAECNRDPLILDLNGDRNVVRELYDSEAYFDLDNDGFAERVAWTLDGDGLLVRDVNGNGVIDDGSELFGSGRSQRTAGQIQQLGSDGFSELSTLDSNGDQIISSADAAFSTLQVWVDADADGITQTGELKSLNELGIASISLRPRTTDDLDCGCDGTIISSVATVTRTDGSTLGVYDAFLSLDQYDTREVATSVVSEAVAALPQLLGSGTLSDLHVAMSRDPELEAMVRGIAQLTPADYDQIADRTEQIILRWTGSDLIDPSSRGGSINARWLNAIERISGSAFVQSEVGSNPRSDAAEFLINDWQALLSKTAAKLIGQSQLGGTLTPGLEFAAGAFFTVEPDRTLQSTLSHLATFAPNESGLAVPYWRTMLQVLANYQEAFGVTKQEFLSSADAALVAAGITIPANALLDMGFVGQGGTLGVPKLSGGYQLVGVGAESFSDGAGSDTYLVSKNVVSLTIKRQNTGTDTIWLYDQTRAEVGTNLTFDPYLNNFSVRLSGSNGNTVQFAGSLSTTGLRTAIDVVRYADGSETQVADLLAASSISYGSGLLKFGSSAPLVQISGAASSDDLLIGLGSSDRYLVGAGGASDTILDATGGTDDHLVIAANSGSVRFSISDEGKTDLIITYASGEQTKIRQQLAGRAHAIETFDFADGTSLSADAVRHLLTTGTATGDVIQGTYFGDRVDGMGGGDEAFGGAGGDTYVFKRGYGELVIVDTGLTNSIEFGTGVTVADIVVSRDGDDLILGILGTKDAVRLKGAPFGESVGQLRFADGEVLLLSTFVGGTSSNAADGAIRGTFGDDYLSGDDDLGRLFDGRGGRDSFSGGAGDDRYFIQGAGRYYIYDAGGEDVLLAGSTLSFDDITLSLSYNGSIQIGFEKSDIQVETQNRVHYLTGLRDDYIDDDVEAMLFTDGRSLDITQTRAVMGSAGADLLYSFARVGSDVFTPGAGNDRIFALGGAQTVEFEANFGRDVIYADRQLTLTFAGIAFAGNAHLSRVANDLVIKVGAADQAIVRDAFAPLTDGRVEQMVFSDVTLDAATIAQTASAASSGADLLFGSGPLDGGAGDDVLIGDGSGNEYVFSRGYGHDVIKEQDSLSGNDNQYFDRLRLIGLMQDDVTFTRDRVDLETVILTIKDTGETLRFDGTPFDDYRFEFFGEPAFDRSGAHWIDEIIFADGTIVSQRDVLQDLADAEANDTDNVLDNFGSPLASRTGEQGIVLDGRGGNDTYRSDFGIVRVRLGPVSDQDRIEFDESADNRQVSIELHQLSISDIFVRRETLNGRRVTVIETSNGSSLHVAGFPPLEIKDESGQLYNIYNPSFDGGFVAETVGGAGVDFLTGYTFITGNEGGPARVNDVFRPGHGGDVIAGRGGLDTVLLGVGSGLKTLLSGGDATSNRQGYVLQFEPGLVRDDVDVTWEPSLNGTLRVSFGAGDAVLVDATALSALRFADGTIVRIDSNASPASTVETETSFFVETGPGDSPDLTVANDYIANFSSGGRVTLTLERDGGVDTFKDYHFDELQSSGGFDGAWRPSKIILTGGDSLDDFEFVRDADNPQDLVVRNIETRSAMIITGQFSAYGETLENPSNDRVLVDQVTTIAQNGGTSLFSWAQIVPRVVTVSAFNAADEVLDIGARVPTSSDRDDRILALPNESTDSLRGNDAIVAPFGKATISWGKGKGHDIFGPGTGAEISSGNTVDLTNIFALDDITFSRSGLNGGDLVLTIRETGETFTLASQLARSADEPSFVTSITLASGEYVSSYDFVQHLSGTSTAGDDQLSSGSGGGVMDGGRGRDKMHGGSGSDFYIFGRDYGEDEVIDAGGFDTIIFGEGIASADLSFDKTGVDGKNLLIEVLGTERLALTVLDHLIAEQRVERFQFADGTALSWTDINRLFESSSVVLGEAEPDDFGPQTTGSTVQPETAASNDEAEILQRTDELESWDTVREDLRFRGGERSDVFYRNRRREMLGSVFSSRFRSYDDVDRRVSLMTQSMVAFAPQSGPVSQRTWSEYHLRHHELYA